MAQLRTSPAVPYKGNAGTSATFTADQGHMGNTEHQCFRTLVRRKEWSLALSQFSRYPELLSKHCSGYGTPLHLVAMYDPPKDLIQDMLASYSYAQLLQDFHSSGSDGNAPPCQGTYTSNARSHWTPLHIAAAFLSHNVFTCVLEHQAAHCANGKTAPSDVLRVKDPNGRTPLFVLTRCYGRNIKRHLLGLRALITAKDSEPRDQEDVFKRWVLLSFQMDEEEYTTIVSKQVTAEHKRRGRALPRIKPPTNMIRYSSESIDVATSTSEYEDFSSSDGGKGLDYHRASKNNTVHHILETTQLCLRSLASSNNAANNITPIFLPLHNAVQCSNHFPSLNIIRYLLWRNPEQVFMRNDDGDLPLHIACQAESILRYDLSHDFLSDYTRHDEKHALACASSALFTITTSEKGATWFYPRSNAIGLLLILDGCGRNMQHDRAPYVMARQMNRHCQIPMHLAAASGKTFFHGGLFLLWKVFPDSLKIADPMTRLYAFMAAAAAVNVNDDFSEASTNLNEPTMKDNSLTTVYCLLRACPEMERFTALT
jgi:ankyrin repeat protein